MGDKVRDALAELVALKDLKTAQTCPIDGSWMRKAPRDEYCRRQTSAWEAARSALASSPHEQAPKELTDERIDNIADLVVKGMPEGISGFCKSWGWRQFARAILDDCRGHWRAQEQAPGWMPIETAPKDGTCMLLWWGDQLAVGYWAGPFNGWVPKQVVWPIPGPTHYTPLPAAPSQEQANGRV